MCLFLFFFFGGGGEVKRTMCLLLTLREGLVVGNVVEGCLSCLSFMLTSCEV